MQSAGWNINIDNIDNIAVLIIACMALPDNKPRTAVFCLHRKISITGLSLQQNRALSIKYYRGREIIVHVQSFETCPTAESKFCS